MRGRYFSLPQQGRHRVEGLEQSDHLGLLGASMSDMAIYHDLVRRPQEFSSQALAWDTRPRGTPRICPLPHGLGFHRRYHPSTSAHIANWEPLHGSKEVLERGE